MSDSELLKLGEERAKEIGLTTRSVRLGFGSWDTYDAEAIWKLLGDAAGVAGTNKFGDADYIGTWTRGHSTVDTHTALLIAIRPLVKETEERKLLREFVEYAAGPNGTIERARKLLEGRDL